jgi:hypothetical protein
LRRIWHPRIVVIALAARLVIGVPLWITASTAVYRAKAGTVAPIAYEFVAVDAMAEADKYPWMFAITHNLFPF